MKFVCLGYFEESAWDKLPKAEQDALLEACFAHDEEMRKNGQWIDGGAPLQSARTARTLRWQDGRAVVIDGPYAETKEQLGGFGMLEAGDMNEAVEIMSRHPGVRIGPFEIRPLDEAFVALWEARQKAAAQA